MKTTAQESLKTLIQLTGLAISVAPVLYAKQLRFNVNESTGKITIPAGTGVDHDPRSDAGTGTTGLGTHGIRSGGDTRSGNNFGYFFLSGFSTTNFYTVPPSS